MASNEPGPSSVQRRTCAIATCKGPYPDGTSFHRFPRDKDRLKAWIVACKRADSVNVKTAVVCSKHFVAKDFLKNSKKAIIEGFSWKRKLTDTAVPSLDLPGQKPLSDSSARRRERAQKRDSSHLVQGLIQAHSQLR